MIFNETKLKGACTIDLEKRADDRGFFARGWCRKEFAAHGIQVDILQGNVSWNPVKGTLRGMHWQVAPHEEGKLVRCVRGRIYDAIVDIRPGSPTQWQWIGVELSSENFRMLWVPPGFAHGFQTLEDNCEVNYLVSAAYSPEASRGLRFDDPAIGIAWPLPVTKISDADRGWPAVQKTQAAAEAAD